MRIVATAVIAGLFAAAAHAQMSGVAGDAPVAAGPGAVKMQWVAKEFLLPIPGANRGLDVLKVEVQRPGKHPLALLTHGTAVDPQERARVTPWGFFGQAIWFARRGYVVLVVVRKGYGRSDGAQDSRQGGCQASAGYGFEDAGEESAGDLRAVAKYAATLPEVDSGTIVSAGVSTGGFAQVALTAKPPAGLKAAISFAGGRGSDGKEHNCNEDGIVSAFKNFGKKSRVPMLWVYSENDHFFPPAIAHKFDAAFKKGGGDDEFTMVPPSGDDGHHFFQDIAGWTPIVEAFLKEHDLLPLPELLPEPGVPDLAPPAGLRETGLKGFHTFLMMGPMKAFATDGSGAWGASAGQWDQEIADKKALDNCRKAAHTSLCAIVARTQ